MVEGIQQLPRGTFKVELYQQLGHQGTSGGWEKTHTHTHEHPAGVSQWYGNRVYPLNDVEISRTHAKYLTRRASLNLMAVFDRAHAYYVILCIMHYMCTQYLSHTL